MLAGKKLVWKLRESNVRCEIEPEQENERKKSILGEPAVHTRITLHDTRMDLPITRSIRKGPEGWKIKQKDKLLVIRV